MKKHRCIRLLALALATLLLSAALPFSAAAADDIAPFFTDEAFRMAVRASLGIAPNAPITAAQASTVTHLYAQSQTAQKAYCIPAKISSKQA